MAAIAEITKSRVYVQTQYGEPVVSKLKSLGAHWDAERKQWWLGRAKESEVKALVSAAPASVSGTCQGSAQPIDKQTKIIGSARYKGKHYWVVWFGQTRNGEAAKLSFRDGSNTFWAGREKLDSLKLYRGPISLAKLLEPKTAEQKANYEDRQHGDGGPRGEQACYMCGSHYCEGARGGLCDED